MSFMEKAHAEWESLTLRKKPKKQRIVALKVNEVSLVDSPAVQGARIVVAKRMGSDAIEPQTMQDVSHTESALAKVLRVLPDRVVPALCEIVSTEEFKEIEKAARRDSMGFYDDEC